MHKPEGYIFDINRYPYDSVVTFVYRHRPGLPPQQTRILEVGCGAGNNLWFAARERFQVTGIDRSPVAIEYARNRFVEEGLSGDFRVGEFNALPFGDASFELAIDRAALTYGTFAQARQAIAEVRRVLVPGGRFFFNPYSDHSSSFNSSKPGEGGLRTDIKVGLNRWGPTCFWGRQDVEATLGEGWRILSLTHVEQVEWVAEGHVVHAEWRAIAERM